MKKIILTLLLLSFPAFAIAAPICGKVYGPPSQTTVVNDYITGENGSDVERITSRSGPYTLCGSPNSNPYWIGSDQVRWYWLEGDSCPYDRYYTFYYTSGGSCTSSCSDGVINQDETDFDVAGGECGGVCGDCTPLEPVECSDTVISGDELGIDCGGSCLASCVDGCPDGFAYDPFIGVCTGTDISEDEYYNPDLWPCESGFESFDAYPDLCIRTTSMILVADTINVPDYVSPDAGYSNDQTISMSSTSALSVVDNLDGTSTSTSVTTESELTDDGSNIVTKTTTTTTTYNTATGVPLSVDVLTSQADAQNEITLGVPIPEIPALTKDGINFQPLLDAKDVMFERFPFSLAVTIGDSLDTLAAGGVDVPCWSFPLWNGEKSYSICMTEMEPLADYVRNLLHWVICILVLYKIYRRWSGEK